MHMTHCRLDKPNFHTQANVTIIDRENCGDYSSNSITETMICAGIPDIGGKDACQGDSGGPIVTLVSGSYEIVGATSWGIDCARAEYPGIYADVFCKSLYYHLERS